MAEKGQLSVMEIAEYIIRPHNTMEHVWTKITHVI